VEFTLVFGGTPAQFTAFIAGLEQRAGIGICFVGDHDDLWSAVTATIPRRSNAARDLVVTEQFSPFGCSATGYVTAQTLSGQRALLIVFADDAAWSQLRPAWDRIADELAHQGWLEAPLPPTAQPVTDRPKKRGPNRTTEMKLDQLRAIRRERKNAKRPSWTDACNEIDIDPRTAMLHEPELRSHWDDPDA
jgi:hypothetical protein